MVASIAAPLLAWIGSLIVGAPLFTGRLMLLSVLAFATTFGLQYLPPLRRMRMALRANRARARGQLPSAPMALTKPSSE
ncbi:hypothetical protein PPSIR1_40789 [Plesiocystis pacifica SIR-1]|uniref:Uncharacterized protein n=1 Tax=Plesiocystis pacifica SIR-1 TaxID=391625 RepID=A6GHD5_9BACT|nr:hypothetical protein PPSIR1_40789 [Plesiocystis pacifica SIR-1]